MALKKKYLLSKAANGQQQSDVANTAIRNLLTLLSADNKITQADLEETEDYFDWKCPYTGADLRERLLSVPKDGVALDHIVPQNREHCGLNVKGNLVWVDSKANSAKHNKTIEEFLLYDQKVLKDTPESVRRERLEKIKKFQKDCGYNPDEIKERIGSKLEQIYKDITDRQKDFAMELEQVLNKADADKSGCDHLRNETSDNTKTARNTTKYILKGNEYSKRRLALFVVGDYVNNHPNITYNELVQIFDINLSFDGKPIIRLAESVSQKEKDANRVYWKDPIVLKDGKSAVVNTQWQKDDMPVFLELIEKLGYVAIPKEE